MTTNLDVLRAIDDFIEANEYSPTLREICQISGMKITAVHQAMQVLRRQGLITYRDKAPRTVRVTEAGRCLA